MARRQLSQEQPAHFVFKPETRAKIDWWIAKYPEGRKASAVIPVLWLVQKQEGFVSEPAIIVVAELLNMPKIRVLEVATFYTMFQLKPVGRAALVQICGTTPCRLRGAEDLISLCEKAIGPQDHLSEDGLFTWQEVECLGACANAPMAQINDYYYEDLTPASLETILTAFRKGETPKPGSYIGRLGSEPEGGAMTLQDPKLYDGSYAERIKDLPNAKSLEPQPKASETSS